MTGLAAVLLAWHGPLPTVNVDYSRPHQPSRVYMLLAFPLFGALCAEAALRVHSGRPWRLLAAQLSALSLLAVARLTTGIPVSGHVMLATFFVLWIQATGLSTVSTTETVLAGLTLAYFLYVKWGLWADYRSSTGGLIVGALLALPTWRERRRTTPPVNAS